MTGLLLTLKTTAEFAEWYEELSDTQRTRIDARLDNVKEGHFGSPRSLGSGLLELKWKNGMRVYFSRKKIGSVDVIILWGGFKGTQDADITRGRRLKERYEHEYKND